MRQLILFILFLIVIDFLFGYFFKKIVFDKTISGEGGGNLNFLLQRKKKSDYFIFGTSRAVHHINPDFLTSLNGSGYNAGVNGVGSVVYNAAMLDIILRAGSGRA